VTFQICSSKRYYMTATFDSSRSYRPEMVLFSFCLKMKIEPVSELLLYVFFDSLKKIFFKVCRVFLKVGYYHIDGTNSVLFLFRIYISSFYSCK